ncbi:zf-HC2 domain-containing protein [Streptomyces aureocirculatus]|uniref:zf-HC2 domain-containing protein n=1 Tax=Streptomyces aureocirculatus TaxID=67275 RepID=UPI0004C68F0A|nr:zf-HC2 domain-containing protein [Streptomyces aureocirculatus]
MRPLERHRDAGAYALGVLDEADRFRFEDHLMECGPCRARVADLGLPARALRAHGRSVPYVLDPAAPGAPLLGRLLDTTGRARRLRRRRWFGAVAAGVALAAVGPTAAVLDTGGGPRPLRAAAHDGRTGVAAVLTAREQAWGTEVGLQVRDGGPARVCELVAVGTDGSRDVVTTWRGPGREMETDGGTGLPPEGIERFEVRAVGGGRLLTLRPH